MIFGWKEWISSADALVNFYKSTSLTEVGASIVTREATTLLEAQDNASSSPLASRKSAVSKPSVNQP